MDSAAPVLHRAAFWAAIFAGLGAFVLAVYLWEDDGWKLGAPWVVEGAAVWVLAVFAVREAKWALWALFGLELAVALAMLAGVADVIRYRPVPWSEEGLGSVALVKVIAAGLALWALLAGPATSARPDEGGWMPPPREDEDEIVGEIAP